MSRTAQRARMDAYAAKALLDAAFSPRPIWRMGFDAHVRDWRRHVSRECFLSYHTDSAFARAHDARRDELRSMPLPPWKASVDPVNQLVSEGVR